MFLSRAWSRPHSSACWTAFPNCQADVIVFFFRTSLSCSLSHCPWSFWVILPSVFPLCVLDRTPQRDEFSISSSFLLDTSFLNLMFWIFLILFKWAWKRNFKGAVWIVLKCRQQQDPPRTWGIQCWNVQAPFFLSEGVFPECFHSSSENTQRGSHRKQAQPPTHLDCVHSMPAPTVCKRTYVPQPLSTCGTELFLGEALSCLLDSLRTASIHFTSGGLSAKAQIPSPAANQAVNRRCHLALPGRCSSNYSETSTQVPSPFLSPTSLWVCPTWQPSCKSQWHHLPGQQHHPPVPSSHLFIQATVTS